MKEKNFRFVALDALRGIAAIAVAIFHYVGGFKGYLAVDFFLVLSGFILSHSYLYRETTFVSFVSHRLARLYPLHIFTLFTFALVAWAVYEPFPIYKDGNFFTFFQHLTLTQNIGLSPSEITWNYPSWSISVEFWVNVIFVFFITKSTKNATLLIFSILGFAVIYGNTGHLDIHSENYYYVLNSGMVRGLASFFLGILSYRLFLHYRDDPKIQNYSNLLEALAIVGGLVSILAKGEILAPFFFFVIVTVFSFELGYISSALKRLQYIGTISYSIYLNQLTVIMVINTILSEVEMKKMWILFPFLLILMVYSHFTYKYIEKPFRDKSRDILSRLVNA